MKWQRLKDHRNRYNRLFGGWPKETVAELKPILAKYL